MVAPHGACDVGVISQGSDAVIDATNQPVKEMKMRFLCPTHLEKLQQESAEHLAEYAVRWLCLAHCHRQRGHERNALSFAGCAFEAASLLARRFPLGEYRGPTLLTLSTVGLASQLQRLGSGRQAEEVVDLGCKRLSLFSDRQQEEWTACLDVLIRPALWSGFTDHHLGFRLPDHALVDRASAAWYPGTDAPGERTLAHGMATAARRVVLH